MENTKITPIHPQPIHRPTPTADTAQLIEMLVQMLADAKHEQHTHYHTVPTPAAEPQPRPQSDQNAQSLLQALAGLAIVFCLTFGTVSTVILLWRGAQATTTDSQTHTLP